VRRAPALFAVVATLLLSATALGAPDGTAGSQGPSTTASRSAGSAGPARSLFTSAGVEVLDQTWYVTPNPDGSLNSANVPGLPQGTSGCSLPGRPGTAIDFGTQPVFVRNSGMVHAYPVRVARVRATDATRADWEALRWAPLSRHRLRTPWRRLHGRVQHGDVLHLGWRGLLHDRCVSRCVSTGRPANGHPVAARWEDGPVSA
jgi:hypothetical protein